MKASTVVLAIVSVIAMIAFGLIVLSAMQQGGWTFIALIVGVAALCAIGAGLTAFAIGAYERWIKTRVEARRATDDHEYRMAREGLIVSGGRFIPRHFVALPEPAQAQPQTPIDPRHELLVKLCIATIRSTAKYGPLSAKLMSANDAQASRIFADREKWEDASKYGQDLKFLFKKNGGNPDEQGLLIKQCGNNTAIDLLEALEAKNPALDSAVAALPGISR